MEVPQFGCFTAVKTRKIEAAAIPRVMKNLWSIGGSRGWYYGNWLWKIRGIMDKFLGGVGLKRGPTHVHDIHSGNALDFWRVLVADE